MNPKISVLLCTVRPDHGYVEFPLWHTIERVVDDLCDQTFKDFELIVVDGVSRPMTRTSPFPMVHVPPRDNLWTRNKKVAISSYRNTGLSWARGEMVVNLDDCCVLPPNYLEIFWRAWSQYGCFAAMTWPKMGDSRTKGLVTYPGQVFGFGSYPTAVAVELNGYDEAYDGCQGLEDVDWSTRLFHAGVRQVLVDIPGFSIEAQSGHDPSAIDKEKPIVKCCNMAWQTERVWREVREANRKELWTREALQRLIGPCQFMNADVTCKHHRGRIPCGYLNLDFAQGHNELADKIFEEPPVFDLAAARKENGVA